jgi:hypothetical protein
MSGLLFFQCDSAVPRTAEGAHGGRLARPGGAEASQQEPLVAGERGQQGPLPVVEPGAGAGLVPGRGLNRVPRATVGRASTAVL